MDIGKKIKQLRKEKGVTQKQLAERTGIATITIQQYEANKYKPKIEKLRQIAIALDVPLWTLLGLNLGSALDLAKSIDSAYDSPDEVPDEKKQLIQEMLYDYEFYAINEQMLSFLDELNWDGKQKALEQVALLSKIPEYRHDAEDLDESE